MLIPIVMMLALVNLVLLAGGVVVIVLNRGRRFEQACEADRIPDPSSDAPLIVRHVDEPAAPTTAGRRGGLIALGVVMIVLALLIDGAVAMFAFFLFTFPM